MASLLFIAPIPLAKSSSPYRRPQASAARLRRGPYSCETSLAPTKAEVDKLFTRLKHVNGNLRKKACAELSEIGTPDIITRLASLLDLDDTTHRRAAVQALGMTGTAVIPTVMPLLRNSPNSTVRASCAKVLAAVALFFPEAREAFPGEALEGLQVSLEQDPDPVTKIATVGCLGTLGSDVNTRDDVIPGNDQAVDILVDLCGTTNDMAVGATVVGAIAQIGQNGSPERKASIVEVLRKLADAGSDDDTETGFNYIKEMAASHLDQLEGGTRLPEE